MYRKAGICPANIICSPVFGGAVIEISSGEELIFVCGWCALTGDGI